MTVESRCDHRSNLVRQNQADILVALGSQSYQTLIKRSLICLAAKRLC